MRNKEDNQQHVGRQAMTVSYKHHASQCASIQVIIASRTFSASVHGGPAGMALEFGENGSWWLLLLLMLVQLFNAPFVFPFTRCDCCCTGVGASGEKGEPTMRVWEGGGCCGRG
jgi:hypothetical protein